MKNYLVACLLIITSTLMSGCFARPANFKRMVPEDVLIKLRHDASVGIVSKGGKGTSALWGRSQISNEGLEKAIEKSIRKYGVFREVVEISRAEYVLTVQQLALDQPLAGFNMQVRFSTNWSLHDRSGKKVWEEFIVSNYKATFGEAILGTNRLKDANEGAAREVIQKGLEAISSLRLQSATETK